MTVNRHRHEGEYDVESEQWAVIRDFREHKIGAGAVLRAFREIDHPGEPKECNLIPEVDPSLPLPPRIVAAKEALHRLYQAEYHPIDDVLDED